MLISAVPDPNLPFGELVKNEPNYSIGADRIRDQSSEIQHEFKQVANNHFVKQWDKIA
ncbi:Oligopeptide transport ATP-binding protein OppF [Vibrio cyclitrophicus]|nr:Oligopeptide transport ATP-binding protein OppF [Vibrio cyclitrophicus]